MTKQWQLQLWPQKRFFSHGFLSWGLHQGVTTIPTTYLYIIHGSVFKQVDWSGQLRHRARFLNSHALQSGDLLGCAHGQKHPQTPTCSTTENVHYGHVAVHCHHWILCLQKQLANFGVSVSKRKRRRKKKSVIRMHYSPLMMVYFTKLCI